MGWTGSSLLADALPAARAVARSAAFLFKVLPMLPSKWVDRVTPSTERVAVSFARPQGSGTGDLYRPSHPGPHPGLVVCLGVVPQGFDHPQIPRLGEALARSGFAALLYRSPAMERFELVPEDVGNVAAAYDHLLDQPFVRAEASGLLGTCVGASFALMAAAQPSIRDRVGFVGAFAPYASIEQLALGVVTRTRQDGRALVPWAVDPLTRKVFVHSLTATLPPREADILRRAFDDAADRTDPVESMEPTMPSELAEPMELTGAAEQPQPNEAVESADGVAEARLSDAAIAVRAVLAAAGAEQAQRALDRLPTSQRHRMEAISPLSVLQDVRAPLIMIGHDRDDLVVPVGESRRLRAALSANAGLRYTEFAMFQHADPTQRKLSPPALARELARFYGYVYPLFRASDRRPLAARGDDGRPGVGDGRLRRR